MESELPPANNHKRNKALLITALIFIVLGAGWFTYWWVWGRFYQFTDDAYVDGNNICIDAGGSGIAVSFSVLDADFVPKGRVLVELDKTDASIALDRAVADLGNSVRDVVRMFETVNQLAAMIDLKKAEFVKTAQDYEHRKNLVDEGGVSLEDFEHAEAALKASYSDLIATEHEYIAALAQVENTTIETHPQVEQMKIA